MPVYVAYDDNVNASAIDAGMALFRTKIKYTTATSLDISSEAAVSEAMIDMQALFLCSGNTPFVVTVPIVTMIQSFVQNGGILLYSSGEEGLERSFQVASWLGDPKIETTSTSSFYTVNYYYSQIERTRNYWYNLNFGFQQYRGAATNQSLHTAFGRSSINQAGLPWQWFAPDMYWVDEYTKGMVLTPSNEEYCMFKREGDYGFFSNSDTCYLFAFPHGSGYAVEISTTFTNENIFDKDFITTNIRIIEAALRLNEYHPAKQFDVILSYYINYGGYGENDDFTNVAYDLATGANVFVWRNYRDLNELSTLLALTSGNTLFIRHAQTLEVSKKDYYGLILLNDYYYQQFVDNGGNLVR